MIIYASKTGTRRNVALMKQGGWRMLLSPYDLAPVPLPYALDNGAWSADQKGVPFDEALFQHALENYGGGADWVAAPDILRAGVESLAFSEGWMARIEAVNPRVLIVLQDGMEPRDLIALYRRRRFYGFFLGGSTEWKEATMRKWGRLARRLGLYYHIGRVNTTRRLSLASWSYANSVDGTSGSKFAETIPMLTYAAKQPDLF